MNMLAILASFTAGSATGLVTLSHVLSYVLKHFKNITTAVIIGFISGSLGWYGHGKKPYTVKMPQGNSYWILMEKNH